MDEKQNKGFPAGAAILAAAHIWVSVQLFTIFLQGLVSSFSIFKEMPELIWMGNIATLLLAIMLLISATGLFYCRKGAYILGGIVQVVILLIALLTQQAFMIQIVVLLYMIFDFRLRESLGFKEKVVMNPPTPLPPQQHHY